MVEVPSCAAGEMAFALPLRCGDIVWQMVSTNRSRRLPSCLIGLPYLRVAEVLATGGGGLSETKIRLAGVEIDAEDCPGLTVALNPSFAAFSGDNCPWTMACSIGIRRAGVLVASLGTG